jgi:Domain of unknown function (DUF5666)
MNADTRSPHLDLEDLIAEAAGQPIGDRAREHIAACEHCQLEVNRWNLVADGVRGLAAAAPEAAAASAAAQPARPRRAGQRVPKGPWRRALLVAGSAAAALVLLVGVGAVTGHVHVHLSGPSTQTALTAVTGCTQLEQADGTLEQVNGSSLVIKTASGQPVTVTTTATTFVSMSGALLSAITDGASVMVRGSSSDGTIKATIVTVGQPFSAVNPPGFVPVQGTVSDASTAGFTLVTSSGTRVPVTTSRGTLVVVPHASPGQLQAGASIFAVGHAGPDGTLSASGVAAVSQLPSGPHIGVSVKDCSPRAITEALGAISATPASAG